jgi:hypothetical protein
MNKKLVLAIRPSRPKPLEMPCLQFLNVDFLKPSSKNLPTRQRNPVIPAPPLPSRQPSPSAEAGRRLAPDLEPLALGMPPGFSGWMVFR